MNKRKMNIKKTQKRKIDESFDDEEEFVVHGTYTLGNSAGLEVMLNRSCDAVRVRFNGEEDDGEWIEIEYDYNDDDDNNEESLPFFRWGKLEIPFNEVMRV